MFMSHSVLYKNTDQRQVVDLPGGLSELTVLKTLHNHGLMIRTIHTEDEITEDSTTLNSTTFKVRNPEKNQSHLNTLTTVDDGLGMCVELGLGMKMMFQWTVHKRSALAYENIPRDGNMEKATFMHDQDDTSGSLCLLEEASFRMLRPYSPIVKGLTKSLVMKRILDLLEGLKDGDV